MKILNDADLADDCDTQETEPDMACSLLHMIEQPEPNPYQDSDLKDLVGSLPRFFCAQCTPPRPLRPGEMVKCLDRTEPCWKPANRVCAP